MRMWKFCTTLDLGHFWIYSGNQVTMEYAPSALKEAYVCGRIKIREPVIL